MLKDGKREQRRERERWRVFCPSDCVFIGLFSKCLGALLLFLLISLSLTLFSLFTSTFLWLSFSLSHTHTHNNSKHWWLKMYIVRTRTHTHIYMSLSLLLDFANSFFLEVQIVLPLLSRWIQTYTHAHYTKTYTHTHLRHWPDNSNCCL